MTLPHTLPDRCGPRQISAWTVFFFFLLLPMLPIILALLYPHMTWRGFKVGASALAVMAQIVMITRWLPGRWASVCVSGGCV
jgi:hypothetical protein